MSDSSCPRSLYAPRSVEQPRYQTAVDIHCMPGSYHGQERPGDVSAGANYDCGIFATTAGGLGALKRMTETELDAALAQAWAERG